MTPLVLSLGISLSGNKLLSDLATIPITHHLEMQAAHILKWTHMDSFPI